MEEEKKFSIGLSSVRVKSETKKQKLTEHKADIPEMNSEKELTPDQLDLEDSNFKGKFLLIISLFLTENRKFDTRSLVKNQIYSLPHQSKVDMNWENYLTAVRGG